MIPLLSSCAAFQSRFGVPCLPWGPKTERLASSLQVANGPFLLACRDRSVTLGWDSGAIDAFVMSVAALRGDVVYTGDVADMEKLCAFFPGVRVLSI